MYDEKNLSNGCVNDGFEESNNVKLTTSTSHTTQSNGTDTFTGTIHTHDKHIPPKSADEQDVTLDFDDLLPHIGEFGRYQKILFLCMTPFAVFLAFIYFSQIFITLVPKDHWCDVPELSHLNVEQRQSLAIPKEADGSYSKCKMYAVNFDEIIENNITVADPNWPTHSCRSGWEYDFTDIPYPTIATELHWVCENSYLPTTAQSIFYLGSISGGLLFGHIADNYGRIPSLIFCNLIAFIAGIATIFSNSFWTFAFCRYLYGFAYDNCFTIMYILVLEYVGVEWRTFVANMSFGIFFTLGSLIMPWMAYYMADWRLFCVVTSLPLALVVITPWVVPESARWLVSQGKTAKAIRILRKFEKVNKTTVAPEIYDKFQASCEAIQKEEADNASYSILDLFKTPRLRNNTLLLIVTWMSISLVFDGHVRNVENLGLDLFITFTVACATELPADMLLTLTLDKWGRRCLAFATMSASGLFSLIATIVPVGVYSATLAIFGRFCVNISYNIGLQYAAELLPTVVRAQGVAFIHIMGYVSAILSPFVVYLAQIYQPMPLIVLGVIGIFGGFLSLFLPETLGQELPQNLADGEEFGRNQKMWSFPCISRKSIGDEEKKESQSNRSTDARGHGASLRASTRGEIRSTMLRRSVKSRNSQKSITGNSPSIINTRL